MQNFDIQFVIFKNNWIYYNLLKIKDQKKNPGINISVSIIKLADQMISK